MMIRVVFPVLLYPLAGTVCDGSAGNFPNTGPVVKESHSSSAEGPVISSPVPKDNGKGF